MGIGRRSEKPVCTAGLPRALDGAAAVPAYMADDLSNVAIDKLFALPRWTLLTALTWIATRDRRITFKSSLPNATISSVEGLMLADNPHCDALADTWRTELGPKLADKV